MKWWHKEETPQLKGRRLESGLAKSYGATLHPNSGAGKIKDDASSATNVYEFKTTSAKGYRLDAEVLTAFLQRAQRVDKEATFVIDFLEHGLRVEVTPMRLGNHVR